MHFFVYDIIVIDIVLTGEDSHELLITANPEKEKGEDL